VNSRDIFGFVPGS